MGLSLSLGGEINSPLVNQHSSIVLCAYCPENNLLYAWTSVFLFYLSMNLFNYTDGLIFLYVACFDNIFYFFSHPESKMVLDTALTGVGEKKISKSQCKDLCLVERLNLSLSLADNEGQYR